MVSSSLPIAFSIPQNSESPSAAANSLANCLISWTVRLMIHLPGLPRAGLPTSDFVSPPGKTHVEDGDPELTQPPSHQLPEVADEPLHRRLPTRRRGRQVVGGDAGGRERLLD